MTKPTTTKGKSHKSVTYDFDAKTWTCECGVGGPIPDGWNRAASYLTHSATR